MMNKTIRGINNNDHRDRRIRYSSCFLPTSTTNKIIWFCIIFSLGILLNMVISSSSIILSTHHNEIHLSGILEDPSLPTLSSSVKHSDKHEAKKNISKKMKQQQQQKVSSSVKHSDKHEAKNNKSQKMNQQQHQKVLSSVKHSARHEAKKKKSQKTKQQQQQKVSNPHHSYSYPKTNNGKLLFVLHIGPHKTATTAIQCTLVHRQKYLRKASFVYLARYYWNCIDRRSGSLLKRAEYIDSRGLITCLNHHHSHPGDEVVDDPHNDNSNNTDHKHTKKKSTLYNCNEKKEWKEFESLLKYHSTVKSHIIMSDEAFSRMKFTTHNLELLSSTLRKYNYHPRVVIGYRRYYEWLLSFYNEYAEDTSPTSRKKWPKHQRESFPSIYRKVERSTVFNSYTQRALQSNTHPAAYLRNIFQAHPGFDNSSVVVFNIHDSKANNTTKQTTKRGKNVNNNNLITSFFHQVFTKQELQQNEMLRVAIQKMQRYVPNLKNKSVKLDYDMITVAAHKKGLVKKKIKRDRVHKAVQKHYNKVYDKKQSKMIKNGNHMYDGNDHDRSNGNPPVVCINPSEQEEFLNRSLAFERQVLLNKYDEKSRHNDHDTENEHRAEFARAAKLGKFCTIDTDQVFEDNEWKKLLASL